MTIFDRFAKYCAQRFCRFSDDEQGVSAIEFAMVLPLMVTLYLGGVEISQAVSADRKITLVTRTIADLVSQSATISNADMTNILNASSAVAAPLSAENLQVRVASVIFGAGGAMTIDWSYPSPNWSAPTMADITNIPDSLKVEGTSLIWAEAQYNYTPAIGYVLTGTRPLTDKIFMRPRGGGTVARTS
jgi:Flp pilus assembly protein TadG